MSDSFQTGEADANLGAPPFETEGARYNVQVNLPQRGVLETPTEPYLMPPVTGGYGEPVPPAISQTPLGAMMPGQDIPPPQVAGQDYRAPVPDEAGPFAQGIAESWPDGAPVPYSG